MNSLNEIVEFYFENIKPKELPVCESQNKNVLGYHLRSTAPGNVEDIVEPHNQAVSVNESLRKIALHLLESKKNQDKSEIVIAIHGYSTRLGDAQERYEKIYSYANKIYKKNKNYAFFGYCWGVVSPNVPEKLKGKFAPLIEIFKPIINIFKPIINIFKSIRVAIRPLPFLPTALFVTTLMLFEIISLIVFFDEINWHNIINIFLLPIITILPLPILLDLEDICLLLPIMIGAMYCISGLFLLQDISLIMYHFDNFIDYIFTCISGGLLFLLAMLFTIIILRVSAYFVDSYRAANYAVLDLVKLLRQLDKAIFEAIFLKECSQKVENASDEFFQEALHIDKKCWSCKSLEEKMKLWEEIPSKYIDYKIELEKNVDQEILKEKRIKISFIAHSMGCFVVTNVVRIISDVFDVNSLNGNITPIIGRVFSLGRLILVAPDIPMESIMHGRTNFLRASLYRFDEAYIFSSEGDFVLRLASTVANYISYPTKTRLSGYRLGNLTTEFRGEKEKDYGIINLESNSMPYEHLEIRMLEQEAKKISVIRPRPKEFKDVLVADRFTYFDCTDYYDCKCEPDLINNLEQHHEQDKKPILTESRKKPRLGLTDYLHLCKKYGVNSSSAINVHGGYYEGCFSQLLIYQLAFLGFDELLDNLKCAGDSKEKPDKKEILNSFSIKCQEKFIRVALSYKLRG